ncbi:polyribonucleotide nucleotidyltransferase [Nitratifractor sp.]
MQEKIVEIAKNHLNESYQFGKVARQADGSVLYRQGKAVLLSTVLMGSKTVDEPFLPLTVQYLEKAYAAGKIPGGFIKRESKPSDFETLTSRIIDRSLRPLFPEGFTHPVVITVLVLSSDEKVDLQVAALHAANAALLSSSLPIEKGIAAVRIGKEGGELRINPPLDVLEKGSLDLLLVGGEEGLSMIEMAAQATEKVEEPDAAELAAEAVISPMPLVLPRQEINDLPEEELLELIRRGTEAVRDGSRAFEEAILPLKRTTVQVELSGGEEKVAEIEAFLSERLDREIDALLSGLSKSERSDALNGVKATAAALLEEYAVSFESAELDRAMDLLVGTKVRRQILEERRRADGRGLEEVRPITIETNLLPSVHGSCLFTRGETQALVTATLGEARDGQIYELLTDSSSRTECFMVHYNFPAFSVGEARPIGAPGRRELGHGNLAKRALEPVIDRELSRTVRLVSEILESNGSSSMATVCGGALALCAAEVEVQALVAGVAMGLVVEEGSHAVLTDIMGLEDHYGDMDFKIAGTEHGITAMQMDVREGGIAPELFAEVLEQARKARLQILQTMEEARKRIQPSGALPVTEHFVIDPSKIVHVIGKAGSTIRDIIQRFEVSIDLDREKGGVKVTGQDREKVQAAKEHITGITEAAESASDRFPAFEKGKRYTGTIKRIVDYGLFVEMPGGNDALLHISKIAKDRVENLRDRYHEGEKIDVVVLDQQGRKIELATPEYVEA